MSDNLKRYCAIHSALLQLYPTEPTGNLARHLKTLAALVCGIIGSKKVHLPAIASKSPDSSKRDSSKRDSSKRDSSKRDSSKRDSRAKRFARFLQNQTVTAENFLPRLLRLYLKVCRLAPWFS